MIFHKNYSLDEEMVSNMILKIIKYRRDLSVTLCLNQELINFH